MQVAAARAKEGSRRFFGKEVPAVVTAEAEGDIALAADPAARGEARLEQRGLARGVWIVTGQALAPLDRPVGDPARKFLAAVTAEAQLANRLEQLAVVAVAGVAASEGQRPVAVREQQVLLGRAVRVMAGGADDLRAADLVVGFQEPRVCALVAAFAQGVARRGQYEAPIVAVIDVTGGAIVLVERGVYATGAGADLPFFVAIAARCGGKGRGHAGQRPDEEQRKDGDGYPQWSHEHLGSTVMFKPTL